MLSVAGLGQQTKSDLTARQNSTCQGDKSWNINCLVLYCIVWLEVWLQWSRSDHTVVTQAVMAMTQVEPCGAPKRGRQQSRSQGDLCRAAVEPRWAPAAGGAPRIGCLDRSEQVSPPHPFCGLAVPPPSLPLFTSPRGRTTRELFYERVREIITIIILSSTAGSLSLVSHTSPTLVSTNLYDGLSV